MRHVIVLSAVVLLFAACSTEVTTGPNGIASPRHRSNDVDAYDCEMSPTKCQVIQAGITYLLQHANISCRTAGTAAQNRYNAPAGQAGYKDGTQAGDGYMYVWAGLSNSTPSGYTGTDGYTYVEPSMWSDNWSDPRQVGSLIAHEEQHQNGNDGPNHNTGIAVAYQQACLNPAA